MLVPKLRFKEFEDEYKTYKLNDVVYFYKGNTLAKSDIKSNGKFPCILYGELYTKYNEITNKIISYTDREDKNLFYSKINDVLIPCSGETVLDISTSTCVLQDNVIIGGDLNVLRPKAQNGKYLSYLLSNKKKLIIAKYAQGDSIVHLYGEKIKNITINLPTMEEQEKVSKLLEILNKKIEITKKKINALKIYKKGLMSKIYNDNNQKELKKIGDICQIEKGKQLNCENMIHNGKYYVLNGGSKLSGYTNNYNTEANTITISEGGNSCGFVNYNKEKFWAGGHCYTLKKINEEINLKYLYQTLKFNEKKIMLLRVGSGLPNIQKVTLENFEIYIHNKEKQKKISDILEKIDKKINNEKIYHKKLSLLKKGLLQKMFL